MRGSRAGLALNIVAFTLPVDWLSELCGLWVIDDVRNDVFGLA